MFRLEIDINIWQTFFFFLVANLLWQLFISTSLRCTAHRRSTKSINLNRSIPHTESAINTSPSALRPLRVWHERSAQLWTGHPWPVWRIENTQTSPKSSWIGVVKYFSGFWFLNGVMKRYSRMWSIHRKGASNQTRERLKEEGGWRRGAVKPQ